MDGKIALTGGIACGKSLVAKYLDEFGVETIDADDIVHEILPDPAERKRLAAEVFADPEKRRALEARLHPLVRARIEAFLTHPTAAGDGTPFLQNPLRLAVIPLLFETQWDADYDIICCVASKKETQLSRMMEKRGYTREEAEGRLAAQLPVDEKAARSHYVINNDSTAEALKREVENFVEWLKSQVPRSAAVF